MRKSENFLQLSGLQHFLFCRRQWALIHIEQQWVENVRTMEGRFLHEKAHSGTDELRGSLLVTRSLPVLSRNLGLQGDCDIVEWHTSDDGISIHGRNGLWLPTPVEYKRGRESAHTEADSVQLCAQAICLEEMLCCTIDEGYIYYGETRRRTAVPFDGALRELVCSMSEEMHMYFDRRYTPKVTPAAHCRACSLVDVCLPKLEKRKSAREYVRERLGEEEI